MKTYNISVIPGDGIGGEVIAAGVRVLEQVAAICAIDLRFEHHPWGSDYYFEHGAMMPEGALELLQGSGRHLPGCRRGSSPAGQCHSERADSAHPSNLSAVCQCPACLSV